MSAPKYTALIDRTEGENDSEEFTDKAAALAFAKEEIKWESTVHVTVIEENDDGTETEIFSEAGEQYCG